MITQAMKRWLHNMFAWWPWKTATEPEAVPLTTPIRRGVPQNFRDVHHESANKTIPWSTNEGVAPPSNITGITPLIFGQGETTRSTIEGWSERVSQSSPFASEKIDPPSPLLPTTPPVEQTIDSSNNSTSKPPVEVKAIFSDVPLTPTTEQQLEFLAYLVRRGLVNEGFPEGQVPDQYRKK